MAVLSLVYSEGAANVIFSFLMAAASHKSSSLNTVAIRVHHMEAMVAFYTEAFGGVFRAVDTFGLKSQFGEVAGITLKLVPLLEAADFDGYPSHQLGFEVASVEDVIALAIKHGGRQEGDVQDNDGKQHAAVRDPDGNTIEVYEA